MIPSENEIAIRELPHANGPEKSVLSSLMKGHLRPDESPEEIHEGLFYLPAHRVILADLLRAGEAWELVAAAERLHAAGQLDAIGGAAYLSEVYTYATNGQHFAAHMAILRDRMARRLAIRVAMDASEAAHDCADPEGFLAALSQPVTAVFDAAADARPKAGMKSLAADFLAEFEDKIAGREIPDGIMTGIHEIDRALHGMKPQHMGIISARSGGGKSTLATQIFANVTDALYLILERTEKSAFARAVIQTAGIHHGAALDPRNYAEMQGRKNPEKGELIAIRDAISSLTRGNRHIVKPSNRRLATIIAEIRRHVRRDAVKVVFLDQIGLVRGERVKGDTGEAELRGISNALQELAHELGIHLVVLCQVNAEGDTKNARAIEEDADWWLSIIQERDKKAANYGEHQHILVAKDSHHGSAGERLPLILDKGTLRFIRGFPEVKEETKAQPSGRAKFRRFDP